jgi:hypothetical protein
MRLFRQLHTPASEGASRFQCAYLGNAQEMGARHFTEIRGVLSKLDAQVAALAAVCDTAIK